MPRVATIAMALAAVFPALAWVVENSHSREDQEKAHAALRAKCDILWAQLDALYFSYVEPGWPPPGAFRPEA